MIERRRLFDNPPLVGRDRETSRLRQALGAMLAGRGGLVLVSGEAGIGKTTLVRWLVSQARDAGALILTGGCFDLTATPPYGPWSEAIRGYQPSGQQPPIPAWFGNPEELGRIGSQAALFEETRRFFTRIADEQPLVIVLEDLHWSDPDSLDALRYISRGLANHRILILITCRADEITRRDPLFQLIPVLVRESGAERVELQAWTVDDIGAFVVSRYNLSYADTGRLVTYLQHRAAGNPLFIVELLHSLENGAVLKPSSDGWCIEDLANIPVPTFVVQLIERRLQSLDVHVRRLLEIAAVVGQEFSLDLWASVSGVSDTELPVALNQALDAGILEEVPGGITVRFHHALIREALYSEVGILERRDLHRATADILLEMPQPDPDDVITHMRPAGDPRLADWLVRSGDRAMTRFAWNIAVEHYGQALNLYELQETPEPAKTCRLLLKLGEAQNNAGTGRGRTTGAGDDSAAQATFWRVVEIAREAGLPQYLGEAALGIAGVNPGTGQGGHEGVRLMAEALDRLPAEDTPLKAQLLSRLANAVVVLAGLQALTGVATVEQVDAWSLDAVAIARRLNDPRALAYALFYRECVIVGLYDRDEREAICNEVIALATRLGDPHVLALGLYGHVVTLSVVGDLESARAVFARHTEVCEQLYMPVRDWYTAVHRSGELLSAGRYEETKRGIEQIDAVWPGSGAARAQTVALYRELGDLEAMRVAMLPGLLPSLSLALRLQYLLEANETVAARELFQSCIDEGHLFQELPKRSIAWLRIAAILAETCAALEDAQRAELIYEQLVPFDGLNIFAGYAQYSMGATAHYLALLATTVGDWDAAGRHFADAVKQNDRWEFRPTAAYTRYEWARMLHKRNHGSDRERARDLLDGALVTAHELGMTRLTRLATAFAGELGSSRDTHPAGLTPREAEVLRLLASGQSNRQIAGELFLSYRTIERHVANIYRKIDAHNRAEATIFALSNGLV